MTEAVRPLQEKYPDAAPVLTKQGYQIQSGALVLSAVYQVSPTMTEQEAIQAAWEDAVLQFAENARLHPKPKPTVKVSV